MHTNARSFSTRWQETTATGPAPPATLDSTEAISTGAHGESVSRNTDRREAQLARTPPQGTQKNYSRRRNSQPFRPGQ